MPGTWLALIGQRLLHADTFALMLSPAIADVQFEASADVRAARHYCGVVSALAGALWFDICADLRALGDDLSMIGVLTAVQASYYGFMLVLLSGLGTGSVSRLDLESGLITRAACYLAAIGIACVVASSACFWPPRRTADAGSGE